jgi:replicative DNA helicase
MPDNPTAKRSSKAAPKAFDKNYGHLQPQAVDIEKVVLGALMIDKDAFSIVSETLRPETFYEPRHQKIYNAIQTLSMNENPVDIMTVVDELKREGTIDDVGGAPYIVDLSSHVASSASFAAFSASSVFIISLISSSSFALTTGIESHHLVIVCLVYN